MANGFGGSKVTTPGQSTGPRALPYPELKAKRTGVSEARTAFSNGAKRLRLASLVPTKENDRLKRRMRHGHASPEDAPSLRFPHFGFWCLGSLSNSSPLDSSWHAEWEPAIGPMGHRPVNRSRQIHPRSAEGQGILSACRAEPCRAFCSAPSRVVRPRKSKCRPLARAVGQVGT